MSSIGTPCCKVFYFIYIVLGPYYTNFIVVDLNLRRPPLCSFYLSQATRYYRAYFRSTLIHAETVPYIKYRSIHYCPFYHLVTRFKSFILLRDPSSWNIHNIELQVRYCPMSTCPSVLSNYKNSDF